MSKKKRNGVSYNLRYVNPKTENQEKIFDAFERDRNLFLYGYAGTGKTFLAMYLTLYDILFSDSKIDHVKIVRSAVQTREIGFTKGNVMEKSQNYEWPYIEACNHLFNDDSIYSRLKEKKILEFRSTTFLRGENYENCYLFVDEIQNLSFHEFDSLITRIGKNCQIILSGDYRQSDLKGKEKRDIHKIVKIIRAMENHFNVIELGLDDIIRSGFVRDYIITKEKLWQEHEI